MPFLINLEILCLLSFYLKYPLKGKNCNKRIKALTNLRRMCFFFTLVTRGQCESGVCLLAVVFFLFLLVRKHHVGSFSHQAYLTALFSWLQRAESLLCKYNLFYYNSENVQTIHTLTFPRKYFDMTPIYHLLPPHCFAYLTVKRETNESN